VHAPSRLADRFAAAADPVALDRLLEAADPVTALKRARARAALQAQASFFFGPGGYEGARSDRPALRNWSPVAGSADRDIIGDLPSLRARTRDAARNQPIAASVINTKVLHVVGTGLKPKAKIDRELLGLSDDEAERWEGMAERVFALHADALDVEGEMCFAEQQNIVVRSALESGDILAIRRFKERPGGLLGTRVQLVEADRICNETSKPATTQQAAGVEIDADGAVIAYHVASGHPNDPFAWPLTWERVQVQGDAGRRAKLFFAHLRPGQRRGVPDLAPVIEKLKQLTRLSEAELAASVLNAFFTVFIKHTGDDASGAMNGYVGTSGTAENHDASGAASEERYLQLGQGTIIDLLEGEDITTASPNRPNAAFSAFWEAMVREVGMATDLPYEIVVKHFQASYSASRAAFLMAWKTFRRHRQWLGGFCSMAWEWTLEEAIARGYLEAPGFLDDPLVRAAWLGVEWIGDAPGEIDEEKAVNAAKGRIEIGASTEERETIALTGGDWEANMVQRKRELAMRQKLGLAPTPTAAGDPAAPPANPDQGDQQEKQQGRPAEAAA
jgi:lambda family phage portal protein